MSARVAKNAGVMNNREDKQLTHSVHAENKVGPMLAEADSVDEKSAFVMVVLVMLHARTTLASRFNWHRDAGDDTHRSVRVARSGR